MNKIGFGIMWLSITGFVTFLMYGHSNPDGTINVNGEVMSQEQFNQMLGPKIFCGIFILVGLYLLFTGIKQVIVDTKTNIHGKETYGLILNISPTGVSVNRVPELQAEILVITDHNQTKTFTEVVGLKPIQYQVGTYALVKYYNNDINLIKPVLEHEVPEMIRMSLQSNNNIIAPPNNGPSNNKMNIVKQNNIDTDTYYLNGEKYTKKKYR
jgi:hypothetical protein